MTNQYTFDSKHNDAAKQVAASKKYRNLVDDVTFTIADDGTPITTMDIVGGFQMLITSINDEFGDMFNIVAIRVTDGDGNNLRRPSIVGRESGSVKDLPREIGKMIIKMQNMS